MAKNIRDRASGLSLLGLTPFKELPIGTILPVVSKQSILPGWLICDGNAIPSKYADLLQLIGEYTPNLTGRTLIGAGSKPQTKNTNKSDANFDNDINFVQNEYGGKYRSGLKNFNFKAGTNTFSSDDSYDAVNNNDLSDNPVKTMQPYYVVYYIIYTGIIE